MYRIIEQDEGPPVIVKVPITGSCINCNASMPVETCSGSDVTMEPATPSTRYIIGRVSPSGESLYGSNYVAIDRLTFPPAPGPDEPAFNDGEEWPEKIPDGNVTSTLQDLDVLIGKNFGEEFIGRILRMLPEEEPSIESEEDELSLGSDDSSGLPVNSFDALLEEEYLMLQEEVRSVKSDCAEVKSKLNVAEHQLGVQTTLIKEKEDEVAVVFSQIADAYPQLWQLQSEMEHLRPLCGVSAPPGSDMWQLQVEFQESKERREGLTLRLEQYQQSRSHDVNSLRAQCEQLTSQLAAAEQSCAAMLFEQEKMNLTLCNLAEEKESIWNSNQELSDKVVMSERRNSEVTQIRPESFSKVVKSVRSRINSVTMEKDSLHHMITSASTRKDSLISSLRHEAAINELVSKQKLNDLADDSASDKEPSDSSPLQSVAATSCRTGSVASSGDEDVFQSSRRQSYDFGLSSVPFDQLPENKLDQFQDKISKLQDTVAEKNQALSLQQKTMKDLRKELDAQCQDDYWIVVQPSFEHVDEHMKNLKSTLHRLDTSIGTDESQHMMKAINTLLSFTPEEFQCAQNTVNLNS